MDTASMLRESQFQRPNIYQVLCEICSMRGKEVPIKDVSPVTNVFKNLTDNQ